MPRSGIKEDILRQSRLELITAALFIGLGLAYGGWAYLNYDLGTLRRIGPGMFPVGLGAILCIIGIFIALPVLKAMAQGAADPAVPAGASSPQVAAAASDDSPSGWRAGVFVLLSLTVFSLVLPLFGAVPALFALVFTAVLAEPGRNWHLTPALIASALSLFVWLLFKLALNLPLTMLNWPF